MSRTAYFKGWDKQHCDEPIGVVGISLRESGYIVCDPKVVNQAWANAMTNSSPTPSYQLNELTKYALRLGTFGFGGPVALVGYMHRDLVEDRKWISETEYKEGLTLAQLMPGPLAAQLAIYLGYVHYGVLGATVVGSAFVLPSFLMVLTLGWAYVQFGGIGWMQAVFYGVGACVIGIILISAYKLTQKTLGKQRLLWAIYLSSAIATIITESESILFFLGAGLLVFATRLPWRKKPINRREHFASTVYADCFWKVFDIRVVDTDRIFFHQSWCVCLWQWSGNRSISLWWRR